jgi:aminoglycoside phosphotransferase (APT) family kinase protein
MEKLAAYLSRLNDLIPGVDTTDSQLTVEGGVGTDVVTIGSRLVALFCSNRVSYTAHRNAAICDRIRPAIALTLPEAVAAAEAVVVFKAIPGLPLDRHWLLRQMESSQERLATQLGGFLRELHAIPVCTLENLKLPDHSTTLDHFR